MNLIQGIFLIDPAGIFKARNNMLVFYFANIHCKLSGSPDSFGQETVSLDDEP